MARITITGATGLLGGNLAEALVEAGHAVRCTRRATSTVDHLAHLDLEWVEADLADAESLCRAFDGAEVVFHCAALISLDPTITPALQRVNVQGTENVIAAARRAGIGRLVHTSSTVAVGLSVDGETPCDESSPFNFAEYGMADGYVLSKRAAEDAVRAADGVDAVVVNPGYIFGPYATRPDGGKMILDVVRGRIPAASSGRNAFVDAASVVRGMIAAWRRGQAGERYILTGENRTYAEMFRAIAEVAGVRPPRFVAPRWMAAMMGAWGDVQARVTGRAPAVTRSRVRWAYCRRFIFDSARARAELGFEPGAPEDGVRAAIDWFRATGRL